MKNPITFHKAAWAACALLALSACSDWTETESIQLVENGIEQQQGAAYAKYLENLKNYKSSDHKLVFGWFDNSEKNPYTRGQHLADVPDSLDIVVVSAPQLTDEELSEVDQLHEKGTKVYFTINYDQIKKAYEERVKEGVETADFSTVGQSEVSATSALEQPFDGLVVAYRGSSPIYLSAAEKAEVEKHQQLLLSAVQQWHQAHTDKKLAFYGYPAHLTTLASLLASCEQIVLVTDNVGDKQQLGIEAKQALFNSQVPADRFIFTVSTVSLDTTDKNTGYMGTDRATSEAAYWMTQPAQGFTKMGLSILNIQNDYYNATNTYHYVREAIQIMNPAPAK